MSVLVKGLNLPEFKREHRDFDRYGGHLTVWKDGKVELHIFDNDYDVVNVPTPHKNLIEVPDFLSYEGLMYIAPNDYRGIAKYFSDQIQALPTIIEAEVSE